MYSCPNCTRLKCMNGGLQCASLFYSCLLHCCFMHSVKEAIADPLVAKYITDGMKKVNDKSVSRAAKVQVSLQY